MSGLAIDTELLERFEKGLDPESPEQSLIPARVLGYGEISTVLEIDVEGQRDVAYKRLAMFESEREAEDYEALYTKYVSALHDRAGLSVVPSSVARIVDRDRGRVVVYVAQAKLPTAAIGNKAIHLLSREAVIALVMAALGETSRVFRFNRAHRGELEIGFDGQISNWAIAGFDPQIPSLDGDVELIYFDTTSPLMRVNGVEQMDPGLFLRCAPRFMVWILRLFFLPDVMSRYYDMRRVTVDLAANFHKEQRSDLVPGLVAAINGYFAAMGYDGYEAITAREVQAYYRTDAWCWRIYLALRRLDRVLHKLSGRDYRYVLPGKTKR